MNISVDKFLWHFNTLPTTPRIEFISPNMNRVIAAFNDFDLVVLIESQPLDLDLYVQDQSFQNSVDTSVDRTSTSIKVVQTF